MDKNIIYITFVDFTEQKSGSSVRPKKIYDAFLEEEYKVTLLTGLQNRRLERWKSAWRFFKDIRKNKYDFCYIEPPAGPIFNLCDHMLFVYISKIKKIPMGLFYRDAYWKFADWYNIKGIKKHIINTMHKFDWFIISNSCKTIYFPTKMMGDLFEFKHKEPLPPACEKIVIDTETKNSVELIYVGGVSEQYGGQLLLETLCKVNEVKEMNLHLVCRKEEKDKLIKYEDKPWLKVYHSSGDELKEIYKKANLAIIPRKVDFYMDFSMPVKLFEYISYEIPIISTQCKEVANFIRTNDIGRISNDNIDSLYQCLLDITIEDIDKYTENIKSVKNNNTWNKRIEQISQLTN